MRNWRQLLLSATFIGAILGAANENAALFGNETAKETVVGEFFVSPNGNDANAGTENAPFATLERARDAVRA
ncbi:MAG: hypothetical protein IJ387_10520, partial [Thermoguttaceae bacterium]|nr:hypothetical protein [Thermoguttaceae bacterium]